jgi:hypothetical protein
MLTWKPGIIKTLTPTDASCFTWYIRRVGQYKILTDYAKENGYNDLLMLYDRFKPIFQMRSQTFSATNGEIKSFVCKQQNTNV